jgi:hypothetical protein
VNPSAASRRASPRAGCSRRPRAARTYIQVGRSNSARQRTASAPAPCTATGARARPARRVRGLLGRRPTWSTPVRLNEDAPGSTSSRPRSPPAGRRRLLHVVRLPRLGPAKDGGEASVYMARSGTAGSRGPRSARSPTRSRTGPAAGTNIVPNQGDYMTLFASAPTCGRCGPTRGAATRRVRGPHAADPERRPGGGAERAPRRRRVTLDWLATPPDTLTMRLYRRHDSGPFAFVDVVQFDAGGRSSRTRTPRSSPNTRTRTVSAGSRTASSCSTAR